MHNSLKKTIIHECGHFTARTLQKELYNTGYEVERIELEEKLNNQWEGRTIPKKPDNKDIGDTIKNHAEHLINLSYGCIFQSLYEKRNDLKLCLNPNGNGAKDLSEILGSFSLMNDGQEIRKKYFHYLFQYYSYLQNETVYFKNLFNIDFYKLIDHSGDKIINLNLTDLRTVMHEFLDLHKTDYDYLVKRVNNIIS